MKTSSDMPNIFGHSKSLNMEPTNTLVTTRPLIVLTEGLAALECEELDWLLELV